MQCKSFPVPCVLILRLRAHVFSPVALWPDAKFDDTVLWGGEFAFSVFSTSLIRVCVRYAFRMTWPGRESNQHYANVQTQKTSAPRSFQLQLNVAAHAELINRTPVKCKHSRFATWSNGQQRKKIVSTACRHSQSNTNTLSCGDSQMVRGRAYSLPACVFSCVAFRFDKLINVSFSMLSRGMDDILQSIAPNAVNICIYIYLGNQSIIP